MENVKGLTQKTHRHTFDAMLTSLSDAGYVNHWKVLNAKDYNVCQNRDRIFVVSIRNDLDTMFTFPEPVQLTQKLTDILESDALPPILHNIYGGFGEKKPRIFNDYSPCIRTAKGGGHIPSVAIIEDFYKAREPRVYTDYAPTLRSGRTGLKVVDGKTIRPLTTLECLRLQSFSDEDHRKLVEIGMSDTQIYKMAGDAINVKVVEELFKALLCPSVQLSETMNTEEE